MQIADGSSLGDTRINSDNLQIRIQLFSFCNPLINHRVAPGRIAAGQYNQFSPIQIIIGTGHNILTEGSFIGRHR